jgi:hypothetical protein
MVPTLLGRGAVAICRASEPHQHKLHPLTYCITDGVPFIVEWCY